MTEKRFEIGDTLCDENLVVVDVQGKWVDSGWRLPQVFVDTHVIAEIVKDD